MSSRQKRAQRVHRPSASQYQPLPNDQFQLPEVPRSWGRIISIVAAIVALIAGSGVCLCGCETLKKLVPPKVLEGSHAQWDPANGVQGDIHINPANGAKVDNVPPPPPLLAPTVPLPEAGAPPETQYASALATTLEK